MPDEAALAEFVSSLEYLPSCLRDFHDAKDVFKTLHATVNVQGHDYCKDTSWTTGQCYVVDVFLWWMAKHGWTLQRSRKRIDFRDLSAAIKVRRDAETAVFLSYMDERRADREATAKGEASADE